MLIGFLVVCLSAGELTARGSGITELQEIQIVQYAWMTQQRVRDAPLAAKYLQYILEQAYGSFWVVEYVNAENCMYGRAGVKSKNDQWVSYFMEDFLLYFWVWVPATTDFNQGVSTKTDFNQGVPAQIPSIQNGDLKLNLKQNVQEHGTGISQGQLIAIERIIDNGFLAKGNDLQDNADFIEQKLVDSFGQNWIVQIYRSDLMVWGRSGIQYENDQWLLYTEYGDRKWHYFIWKPSY